MRRELYVPPQSILEPLVLERAGTPFLLRFPRVIPEQPYLGQVYQLGSINLILTHAVVLKVGQKEAFPTTLECSLQLLRNNWVVGVWPLGFQMRLTPGSEGQEWLGEATISQDLTNPVDYRNGDTLSFAVTGVVPGNIGGPQLTEQEIREQERTVREIELLELQAQLLTVATESREDILATQAEVVEAILDLEGETGAIGNSTVTLLEEILNRLFEIG